MSLIFGLILLVALATCSLPVYGGGGNSMRGWREEQPENCPSVNNRTHVCSTLEYSNATCITIKCCSDFGSHEDYETYDESASSDDDEHGSHGGSHNSDGHGSHGGGHNSGGCILCLSYRTCTLYKCYSSCCDGYERDTWTGRCTNNTGNIQCENGGVLRTTWYGRQFCKCPSGFRGHNCEKPICRCKNGGECVVKDGKPHCNCTEGYYGNRCQKSNCTMTCYNGGRCYIDGGNEFCKCRPGFIGNQCQQHYTNPDTCPLPDESDNTCRCECTRNSNCKEGEVCCKEGCSSVCRKKKLEFCLYEGKNYTVNATYSPDPCTNCTCMETGKMLCYSISCAIPRCVYGEPTVVPGQCCPSCPDKPDPPKIQNCPFSILNVTVNATSDQVVLDSKTTKIKAFDSSGNKLKVKYRPDKVHHCHCSPPLNWQTHVQAYAEDSTGGIATCSFNVSVKDTNPPRFTYCPKDIHVSQNDVVQWKQPTSDDNVGISRVSTPDRLSGEVFPVGTHAMTYQVWDHDGNTASCNFNVVVTRDPPRIDNCPKNVLRLNTSYYTDLAVLNELTTGIQAFDSDDNKIQISYQPQTVNHCKCSNSLNEQYTVESSAEDDYGHVVRCTFKVIVKDIYLPQFSYCPGNINVSKGDGATWKEPVYTDNVGVWQRTVNMENGNIYPVGKHTVRYDVKDYDNNTASCQFNIFVVEAMPEPPKIQNCPVEVLIVNTSYYTDHAYIDDRKTGITALDADGNKIQVKYTPERIKHCHCYDASVEVNVHAEATDSHGNKDTCQFKVTVKDIYKPIFTSCPSNFYVSENEMVEWDEPTYHDNVAVADTSTSGYTSGQVLAVGNHTVYYKVLDFQRNYALCLFNVSVTKEEPKPPKIANCPTQVLHLNTTSQTDQAVLTEEITSIKAYDHEGNKLKVSYQPEMIRHCHCFDSHTTETTVYAWVVDDEGVKETCTFKVIVSDIHSPVINNCPRNIDVSEGDKVEWREPTVKDNVEVVGKEVNRQNGALFSVGRHTVSYIVWDYDLNNASCRFNVSVAKRMPPVIHNCPNYNLFLNAPDTGDTVVLGDSTTSIEAFDSEGKELKVTYRPMSVRHCYCGTSYSNGTLVEATAIDHLGNAATCAFKAFVIDLVKPLILSCQQNIFVTEGDIATWQEPKYYDNVKVANVSVTGRKKGTVFPVGSHRVAYDIWDYDWNYATCQFNVTVAKAKCTLECFNGGLCYHDGNDQFCRCTPDYIGRQCEYKYIHPSTCPVPEPSYGTCDVRCTGDNDCRDVNVCCKEGCSTVCRPPMTIYCQHKGKQYVVNETYSPEPCTTCICDKSGEMMCSSMFCAMPKCAGGRQPVSKPDQCCLTCPEESKPRITCPTQTVHLETSFYSNMTMLENGKTSVEAYDAFGKRLQVNYRPPFVYHCNCHNRLDHVTRVEASASDYHGNIATCSFNVVVRDIYSPVVFSCPEDVFVFEKNIVKWLPPNSVDNVGIADTSCSSKKNGDTFPVGEHIISCDIRDYDGNTASCHFRVSVTRDDTSFENMPIGLRDRYMGEQKDKLHIILPPIFGAILLIILAVVVFFCVRRCHPDVLKKKSPKHSTAGKVHSKPRDTSSMKSSRKSTSSSRSSMSTYSSSASSRSSAEVNMPFHNRMYAIPGDVGNRPPPYTAHPGYSPPPYSVSGSVKDVTYMSFPAPAYHNPAYESLSVHFPSVSGGSTRSGPIITSRSSKQGSSKYSRNSAAGSVKSLKSGKSSFKA